MLDANRLLVLAVVCLVASAGLATAHGNHLSVDAQLSEDGTVVVENLFLQEGGYLAIHADDDSPGAVLAHKQLGSGFTSAVAITIDEEFWSEVDDTATVWATLHRDDGDNEFEPDGDDEIFRSFGGFAGSEFTVGKHSEGRAYVVAASAYGVRQQVDGPAVTVANVSLAEPGYVVVRTVDRDYSPGEVIGRARLDAGTHRNVTVEIDESAYESLDERFRLYAMVYADDGDGEFDPEADSPVTVGGEPVGSLFDLQKTDGDDDLVNTPTTTEDSLVNTPTENETTTTDS
ncbi:hypothetical protein BRC82_05600 [Halobacteriales archaeon QS_1_67_19]|nr:MAG: hypothetical protein BRC82_05600 [Halobacteriales archaeon QS_1_67_19]